MSVRHIAFVMYPVSDMARAVAFYEGVLGLVRDAEASSDMWTEFDIAGTAFAITTVPLPSKPGSGHSLALEVDDLTAFRQALADRGAETLQDYESPVCWMAPVADPDGNTVTLHQLKKR